ncbi:MAG: class II glutamine amidotransferase [bacterium]|nr:class II glutamine amidotransferase [bacterium]
MFKKIMVVLIVYCVINISLPALLSCELMGYSFNQRVPLRYLFEAFRYRSEFHPSGWGIAYYPDSSVQIFKEPKKALESPLAEFLARFDIIKAPLAIAHLRKASVGGETSMNTHPYQRELNGTQYVLAHNGTLKNFRAKLPLNRFKPIGQTDSEYLLCHILGEFDSTGYSDWNEETFAWLHHTLTAANELGTLNTLFSNGEHLFIYHDKNDYTSLHYTERNSPQKTIRYQATGRTVDLTAKYPEKAAGIVFSTKPLSDENWEKIKPGQLLILKDGKIIFDSEQK